MSKFIRAPFILVALMAFAVAACASSARSSTSPGPTPGSTDAAPSAEADPSSTGAAIADLSGTWGCYVYQPGVGTNSVNVSGIKGANSFLGSFDIVDDSTYRDLGSEAGAYSYDPGTGAIVFSSGGLHGLVGTAGAGPKHDLLDLHGVSDGWESPSVVNLVCQAT